MGRVYARHGLGYWAGRGGWPEVVGVAGNGAESSRDAVLQEGEVLADRYQVLGTVGQGGMGLVYAAFDRTLNRKVALKVLPHDRWDDPTAVERFVRQARAMARLEHPGVVRVYDRAFHRERVPYVVMELLAGTDLRHALRAGRFEPARALELAIALCDVVHAVHQHGVIHRDLKPSNVFLVDGDSPGIKLLDFGIAQLASEAPLTATHDVLGTLAYMAPELLSSAHDAGAASDVYGIACILYEMIAGAPPFRAHSRAELAASIQHDAPPELSRRASDLPAGLDALVALNLAKDPSARAASAEALGGALRALPRRSPSALRATTRDEAPHVLGGGRFALGPTLGEGASGTVWAAFDHVLEQRVALKRLRYPHAADVYRLKREFRTAAEIAHPHLIRLHELFLEDGEAYFTMELIEGQNLLSYLRAQPEQIVAALSAVAAALAALHARNIVHRDLKAANVLVDREGRVVLLDLGLAVRSGEQTWVAGTPAYMAPETLEGTIGPEADLYALGVLAHEALTGRRPNAELAIEPPATARALWPLCLALLSADRRARPSAQQVIERLRMLGEPEGTVSRPATAPASTGERERDSSTSGAPFVGRARELGLLRAAIAQAAEGARVTWLRGQSGVGKSTLLGKLAQELAGSTLCLHSRCRDSETIPYPALDVAIDALGDHLGRLPAPLVAALLPRNMHALVPLFPVLQRIDAIAEQCAHGRLPRDPAQVRALGYAALRSLLRKLGERQPLVLIIDDAQWLDPDSAALLECILTGDDPPALLLIGALRDGSAPNACLQQLMAALRERTLHVALLGLDERDSFELVRALTPDAARLGDDAAGRIVEQSGGNPFLLTNLVEHAQSSGEKELRLEHALRARWHACGEPATRVLELCALCERPLPAAVLLAACGDAGHDALRALRRARLLRRTEATGAITFEPYHARVREAVLAGLEASARVARHGALADALRPHAAQHLEALIEQLSGCGRTAEASGLALRAAAVAEAQLAFDRAAALYALALRWGGPSIEERLHWMASHALALRNAGRSVDAAAVLEQASGSAPPEAARRLLREAGELLLFAGRVEAGLALLQPMLARAGIALPASVEDAVASGLRAFAALAERGLTPAAPRAGDREPEVERLELSLVLANGLALIDLRGLPFAVTGLTLALDAGEPERLQRASATFVTLSAGLFFNPLIEPALALCRRLTAELDTPYARALLFQAEGEAAHFSARFLAAEAAFENAERTLLESCVGRSRELAAARNGAVLIEYTQKGDFQSQLARTLGWQADAEVRGDSFHENVLRVAHAIVWIAQDTPEKARRELQYAAQQWRDGAGAYELGMLQLCDVIDRYEGRDDAHLRPLQGRLDMLQSPAASSPFLAGYIHLHRAWGAIRAIARGRHAHGERELAADAIAALRALGPDIWRAAADAYDANLRCLRGEREAALACLLASERAFRGLHMRCLAACARMRHGELAGGAFGARLVHEARVELEQLGVKQPERWSRAYFSLFDPEHEGELTLLSDGE